MSLEQREHGTELSQGGGQKCICVISAAQRYSEEFAAGLRHPETPPESGEKGRMAPTHLQPCGKQVLEPGKASIMWVILYFPFFYRKNCTEQAGAGCSSQVLHVEIFKNNYYDENNNNNNNNSVGRDSS